jgi:hypothetical protein
VPGVAVAGFGVSNSEAPGVCSVVKPTFFGSKVARADEELRRPLVLRRAAPPGSAPIRSADRTRRPNAVERAGLVFRFERLLLVLLRELVGVFAQVAQPLNLGPQAVARSFSLSSWSVLSSSRFDL